MHAGLQKADRFVASVNRAVAVARVDGAAAGLECVCSEPDHGPPIGG